MGAAAGVEINKPTDASDISATGNLEFARGEVMRLRNMLGQYARDAGFSEVIYDASDLVLGENEEEDFERCIDEIIHIRTACRMATQKSRRQTRGHVAPVVFDDSKYDDNDGGSDSDKSDESVD
jgi:hypothetical protein